MRRDRSLLAQSSGEAGRSVRGRGRGAALACLVLTLPPLACGTDAPPPEPQPRPVMTQVVQASGAEPPRIYAGVAEASVRSEISFRVGGMMIARAVDVGDRVARGALIARLDQTDFLLEVDRARAALRQAEANRRSAQASFARIRQLYESGNAPLSEYDIARAQAESADEAVSSARTQLELAEQRLEYATLRTPLAGAIAGIEVEINENVRPGQTVVVLTSGERPQVSVAIPEVLIGRIREGSAVEVAFDAFPERLFQASVTEVGVASLGTATTFPVAVQLDDAAPEIRSGMAAEVVFRLGDDGGDDVIVVPHVAVLEDREGRHVFVVEAAGEGTGRVERRAVRVGEPRSAGVEVLEGLVPGDEIVTAGARRLIDGQTVRFHQDG